MPRTTARPESDKKWSESERRKNEATNTTRHNATARYFGTSNPGAGESRTASARNPGEADTAFRSASLDIMLGSTQPC
jgi:hypothetical protein